MFECPPAIQREMDRLRFTCLDEHWQGRKRTYRFQCEQGHVFACEAGSLRAFRGCRGCRGAERMQRLQRKAAQDGSHCLDDLWQGQAHHYRFRCLKEPSHEWRRIYPEALKGAGCPYCSRAANGLKRRDAGGLQRLQACAASRGGECLSPSYLGVDSKHRFRCAQGHTWEARATLVLSGGSWCRQCSYDLRRIGIDEVRRAAEAHGGQFLSDEYRNVRTRYTWACAEGHTWQADYQSIQQGVWCPTCSPRPVPRLDVQALHDSARTQGGKCLSLTYGNCRDKYQWQCAKGHIWSATLNAVRRGQWCPECAIERRSRTLQDMQRLAEKRGGQCLAKAYRGCGSKYPWLCARGHSWSTTFNNVVRGYWCPTCSYMVRTRPGSAAWRRYQPHGAKE